MYRHTQIGWVIIFSAIAPALVAIPLIAVVAERTIPIVMCLVFGSIIPLFGWMTVAVGRDALHIRLGIGLVRKAVPLSRIRFWQPVRNSFWMGWGIHFIPGGTLWNVSGFEAVELVLDDGRRLRVGTDQPIALAGALEHALGRPAPLTPAEGQLARVPRRRVALIVGSFVVGLALAVGGLIALQARPPVVRVTPAAVTVETLFYGQTYPFSEIVGVELLQRLPSVRLRTNGFAAGGILRGHFLLQDLGEGKLFVNARVPPYILLRLRKGYAIVNFASADQTRALFAEIATALATTRIGNAGQ